MIIECNADLKYDGFQFLIIFPCFYIKKKWNILQWSKTTTHIIKPMLDTSSPFRSHYACSHLCFPYIRSSGPRPSQIINSKDEPQLMAARRRRSARPPRRPEHASIIPQERKKKKKVYGWVLEVYDLFYLQTELFSSQSYNYNYKRYLNGKYFNYDLIDEYT